MQTISSQQKLRVQTKLSVNATWLRSASLCSRVLLVVLDSRPPPLVPISQHNSQTDRARSALPVCSSSPNVPDALISHRLPSVPSFVLILWSEPSVLILIRWVCSANAWILNPRNASPPRDPGSAPPRDPNPELRSRHRPICHCYVNTSETCATFCADPLELPGSRQNNNKTRLDLDSGWPHTGCAVLCIPHITRTSGEVKFTTQRIRHVLQAMVLRGLSMDLCRDATLGPRTLVDQASELSLCCVDVCCGCFVS